MNFGLVGAMGKMGRTISHLSHSSKELQLNAAIERSDNPYIGEKYGSLINIQQYDFSLITSEELNKVNIEGLIDFSFPTSTLVILEKALEKKIPIVIGTTGFKQEEIKKINEASKQIPILLSSNMSLGVNLIFWLVKKASQVLKNYSFDPELIEIHHNQKKDAPSGTAKTLEEIILKEYGWDEKSLLRGRSGLLKARSEKELGSHSLRGGDVVGEHSTYFFGEGERITLSHQATDRNIFASGALNALIFLSSKNAGLYNMQDVLSLT